MRLDGWQEVRGAIYKQQGGWKEVRRGTEEEKAVILEGRIRSDKNRMRWVLCVQEEEVNWGVASLKLVKY